MSIQYGETYKGIIGEARGVGGFGNMIWEIEKMWIGHHLESREEDQYRKMRDWGQNIQEMFDKPSNYTFGVTMLHTNTIERNFLLNGLSKQFKNKLLI